MLEIGMDEGSELLVKVQAIRAIKALREMGFKTKTTEMPGIGDGDFMYSNECYLESVLESMYGPNGFLVYQATQEDGHDIGYDLYYSEDELTINAIQIKSPTFLKYVHILKKQGLGAADDAECADCVSDLVVNNWASDYDMTESMIGLDYSGIYILTTYFNLSLPLLINGLVELEAYCKKKITQFNKKGYIVIKRYKADDLVIKKKKKKRKKKAKQLREEIKSLTIKKRIENRLRRTGKWS